MTINRRDTILIAVLMNIGLLTVLFITAMQFDVDTPTHQPTEVAVHKEQRERHETKIVLPSTEERSLPSDEMDQVLQAFTKKQQMNETVPIVHEEEIAEAASTLPAISETKVVKITVKKGDSLDKIARANKTTIKDIKRLNNLSSDRLQIGQVLEIPLQKKSYAKVEKKLESSPASDEVVYYEIQSGDNPWKIAKKFHVGYDDILQLNQIDEAKAKRLKVGDKIRIK